jgi:putative photosynthetic complex assembly protein 2
MVTDVVWACIFTALCWWLGTGVILWLDRLPQQSFRWSLLGWSVLLIASFKGVADSMLEVSVWNAYLAFGSVIVMWGWHELAFLTGWITGPRKVALSPNAHGMQRFMEAVQVMIHHEIALVINFGILIWMQGDRPNHVAVCTFALLWFMRLSAKLNLFFGVPQNGAQYLPPHLAYLASYFRTRLITPWFLISISAAIGTWCWLVWLAQQGVMAITTGWVMLATLLGLAIVEHLIMIFPWPLERLWGWAMGQAAVKNTLTTQPCEPI